MLIIYQTNRNSDTTEGRGPMVPDLAFTKRSLAETYIDGQPGVQGRTGKWSQEKYGDWNISEVEVLDELPENIEKKKQEIRKRALNKLTDEERKVLGL